MLGFDLEDMLINIERHFLGGLMPVKSVLQQYSTADQLSALTF